MLVAEGPECCYVNVSLYVAASVAQNASLHTSKTQLGCLGSAEFGSGELGFHHPEGSTL